VSEETSLEISPLKSQYCLSCVSKPGVKDRGVPNVRKLSKQVVYSIHLPA